MTSITSDFYVKFIRKIANDRRLSIASPKNNNRFLFSRKENKKNISKCHMVKHRFFVKEYFRFIQKYLISIN